MRIYVGEFYMRICNKGILQQSLRYGNPVPHQFLHSRAKEKRKVPLELLWKEYFRDPSMWWDKRKNKTTPRSPDFKHKVTKEYLWISSRDNPPWVNEELKKLGQNPSEISEEVKDVVVCTEQSKDTKENDGKCLQGLTCSNFNQEKYLVALLKDCGRHKNLAKGTRIHADILKKGLLKYNIYIGNSLVNMYAKCGEILRSQQVFDELPFRDVVSWTAIIAGYNQCEQSNDALYGFEKMQNEGVLPNEVTFICILKACGSIGAIGKGKNVHAITISEDLLYRNTEVGNILVDMYVKCGELSKARDVFDELPIHDVISWTSLIAGYVKHGHGAEALTYFENMQIEGLSPDATTFSSILKACGSIGAAESGEEIHGRIKKEGFLEKDVVLGAALVDMYAKCGALMKAENVFNELGFRNVASWNTLITGYAEVGKHEIAFKLFNKMIQEGIYPDPVTFAALLKACSYSGLVNEGEAYLELMKTKFSMTPSLDHQTCMVGIFARAGQLDKAITAIKKAQASNYLQAWFTVLGACLKWSNVEYGRLAFENAVRLDKESGFPYMCMSKIYAACGMQEDVDKIEAMRLQNESK